MKVLITGGAGFIGSAVCRFLNDKTDCDIVNVDKLTYAASPEAVAALERTPRYRFERADICDEAAIERELFTDDLPPLDLLIRTSGEVRLSNFLLWQAAYAELLFVDTLWPDFDGTALAEAVAAFGQRQRRYGGL